MKKNILKLVFASAFALVAGYSVYASQQKVEISDLVMANVEALADSESDMCLNGCVSNGGGCSCHYWFPTYREYNG